jgi:hypothetical protein
VSPVARPARTAQGSDRQALQIRNGAVNETEFLVQFGDDEFQIHGPLLHFAPDHVSTATGEGAVRQIRQTL